MKRLIYLSVTAWALAGLLSGCSATMLASASYADDDLYALNNRHAIATVISQHNEVNTVSAQTIDSYLEAIDDILGTSYDTSDDILVRDYDEAYRRRQSGRASITYRMPSSYTNYLTGDSYLATLSYDPSIYNVMVMGDQIWVEPKYVTAMFGTWITPTVSFGVTVGLPYYSSWYAWNAPYYSWNRWYWNDWYWGRPSYWYGGWYGGWPGWHGPHHHWHPIGPGRPIHRPGYADIRRPGMMRPGTSGMRPSYSDRLRGTTGTYRRAQGAGESYRPSIGGTQNSSYMGGSGASGRPSSADRINTRPSSGNNGGTGTVGTTGGSQRRNAGVGGSVRRNGSDAVTGGSTGQSQRKAADSSVRRNNNQQRSSSSSNYNSSSTTRRNSSSGSSSFGGSSRSGGFSSGYSGSSSRGYSGSSSGGYSGGGSRRR